MNRWIPTFILLSSLYVGSSQVDKQQQLERERVKVAIFTPEERANLELWFFEETQKMGLTEEVNKEYERIFFSHIYDLGRLNDKDKGLSDVEIKAGFERIIDNMNAEMKQLLTKDQYIHHLENCGEIVRSVYRKMNWKE